jgi:hypothetical protein
LIENLCAHVCNRRFELLSFILEVVDRLLQHTDLPTMRRGHAEFMSVALTTMILRLANAPARKGSGVGGYGVGHGGGDTAVAMGVLVATKRSRQSHVP